MRRLLPLMFLMLFPALVAAQDPSKTDTKEEALQDKADQTVNVLPAILVTSDRGPERSSFELPQSIFVLNQQSIRSGALPGSVPG